MGVDRRPSAFSAKSVGVGKQILSRWDTAIMSRRDLSDFVPEGLNDRSQAIYCLVSVRKREPSRRARYDWGPIGVATIRAIDQPGIRIRPYLRDGFSIEPVPGNKLPG
jgi:hypothetical protein